MIAGASWWATFGLGLVIGALVARLPDLVGWVADRFDQYLDHQPPPPPVRRPARAHVRLVDTRRPFDQDGAA